MGATGGSPLTMRRQFESSNGFEKLEPVLSFSFGQPFGGSNITQGCIATCVHSFLVFSKMNELLFSI